MVLAGAIQVIYENGNWIFATFSGYRINHDLFADYILEKECAPEAYEVVVIQKILDLTILLDNLC